MGRDPPVCEAGVGTQSIAPRTGPLPFSHHRSTSSRAVAGGGGAWSMTGAGPCRRGGRGEEGPASAPQLPPPPSTAT